MSSEPSAIIPPHKTDAPLLSVRGVYRRFVSGAQSVEVLKNIDLDVHAGEFIAIVGSSGSGKSTLMNILGCLDKPSEGHYAVRGRNTADMHADDLASLRREYFGFIFQRYHLLNNLTAIENVAIPAIYAGTPKSQRRDTAQGILQRLGLGEREHHKPSQLSGGQQQRVSIARALINGGEVILADEPTGALDSQSGIDVLRILNELNAEGHTIIMVTHDMEVANNAQRIIEIKDGRIVSDTPSSSRANSSHPISDSKEKTTHSNTQEQNQSEPVAQASNPQNSVGNGFSISRVSEAFKMATRAIVGHRMRSFLTMLGIIIGIASVVSIVALGKGSQEKIIQDMGNLGTNTVEVYPGIRGVRGSRRNSKLNVDDAHFLASQHFIDSASPLVSTSITLRSGGQSYEGQVLGVGAQYFQVKNTQFSKGASFNKQAVKELMPYVVMDYKTAQEIKKKAKPNSGVGGKFSVLGEIVLINNIPARVVGVTALNKNSMSRFDNTPTVYMPYTTVMGRLLGTNRLANISVRVNDVYSSQAAEAAIERLLIQRHGSKDFTLSNNDSVRQMIEKTTGNLTLLVSLIAVISLLVGGVGVMNIMLVSVTERIQEIGVRMAVGARQSDIMQQFLIEAVLLCLLGGVLGVLLSFFIGWVFSLFVSSFGFVYSPTSIVAAFLCSSLIGIAFGFFPARRAARLDPVVALSGE